VSRGLLLRGREVLGIDGEHSRRIRAYGKREDHGRNPTVGQKRIMVVPAVSVLLPWPGLLSGLKGGLSVLDYLQDDTG